MAEKQPTIYDVAELAGVSIATVSRVMNGGIAGRRSQEKVLQAMKQLNYHPSSAAVTMTRSVSQSIALVVSNLENPYYAAMVSGAEEAARERDYVFQLYSVDYGKSIDQETIDRILRQKLDGMILVGNVIENREGLFIEAFSRLERRMPVITIGPKVEGFDSINITSDLSVSVRKSIAHLTSMGHKRIAFIGGSSVYRSASMRETAFFEEMQRLGLQGVKRVIGESGFTPQAGELCVSKLFSQTDREEQPTALIAINDLVALGAMHQLQRMGLRVPEDVSVIGCDNQFFSSYLCPPLTTVDLHPRDRGRCAVEELVSVITSGQSIRFDQIHECSLIVRASTGPAPHG